MLTIFSVPKPFKGHFGVIQRNAISQWARLRPTPEILLFGNEEGTAEIAREFDVRHIPEVKCNEYGTPLLSDVFEKAQKLASHNTLCYVNADIMLLGDFMKAVQCVSSWRDRFLMVGQRTNVDLDEPAIYESVDQEARLQALIAQRGQLADGWWIDYFVFPRGLFPSFPRFVVGRRYWDNWFLWKALALSAALVDASGLVLAVHQNHDYSHHPQGFEGIRHGDESEQNLKVAQRNLRLIEDSTHRLTADGTKYNFRRFQPWAKRAITTGWLAALRATAPVRHPLGLYRANIVNVVGRIRLHFLERPE